tara:strand:+ start:185 stop:1507 length:1323 start_codon:yes stop_codon:yes gene_type:complete
MNSNKIKDIKARLIIDSRGNPTIEADVVLENNIVGRASVPSGASTGDKEALELRDKETKWCGKGVNKAISNIKNKIRPKLIGMDCTDIRSIDNRMIKIDGTPNKSELGANAILAVSLANVQAGANYKNMNLFQYIYNYISHPKPQVSSKWTMPIPMMNILNGGSHADNNVDIQEFMIMPIGFKSYSDSLRSGVEIFHSLKKLLKSQSYNTSIGDEGGFAPNLNSNEEALELILQAISSAGYNPGKNIFLALDVAASEFYNSKTKKYTIDSKEVNALELIDYYKMLCKKYPIVSIEDGLDQNDWGSWKLLTSLLGKKVQIVGDDLTVTNPQLLQKAIDENSMNAILIKLNQIGTFTETLKAIQMAQINNFNTIISHRSGETEGTFISDLSVAVNSGQIKTGSLCRTDRTAKYNQLLRIEEDIKPNTSFSKINYLGCQEEKK